MLWQLSPCYAATTFFFLLPLLPASGPQAAAPQEEEHFVSLIAKAQEMTKTKASPAFCEQATAAGTESEGTGPATPQPLAKPAGRPYPQWAAGRGNRGSRPGSTRDRGGGLVQRGGRLASLQLPRPVLRGTHKRRKLEFYRRDAPCVPHM